MGRRAWQATVHGVTKSRTRLSDFTTTTSTKQLLRAKHCSVLHVVTHFILITSLSAIPGIIPVLQQKKPRHWEVRRQVTRLGCGWAGLRASCPVFPTTMGPPPVPFGLLSSIWLLFFFFFFYSFTFFFPGLSRFQNICFFGNCPRQPVTVYKPRPSQFIKHTDGSDLIKSLEVRLLYPWRTSLLAQG